MSGKSDFKRGMIVKHLLTGENLLVLERGREQIKCRTKNMLEVWFYEFELEV